MAVKKPLLRKGNGEKNTGYAKLHRNSVSKSTGGNKSDGVMKTHKSPSVCVEVKREDQQ